VSVAEWSGVAPKNDGRRGRSARFSKQRRSIADAPRRLRKTPAFVGSGPRLAESASRTASETSSGAVARVSAVRTVVAHGDGAGR
jgi:hypothetical protein